MNAPFDVRNKYMVKAKNLLGNNSPPMYLLYVDERNSNGCSCGAARVIHLTTQTIQCG